MRLSDYMSRERFPLTSQEGCSARGQFQIDQINLDELRNAPEALNERQQAIMKELEEKVAAQPELYQEMLASMDEKTPEGKAAPVKEQVYLGYETM